MVLIFTQQLKFWFKEIQLQSHMNKLIILFAITLLVSCSHNDDSEKEILLAGEWYLSEVNCFCFFDSNNFEEYTLRFDTSKNTLHLNNPAGKPYFIAESGSYEYTIDKEIIIINGSEAFYFERNNSNLILTYVDEPGIADDELVLRYNRE